MSFSVDLDILGQQPLLKIYTQIASVYAVPDDSLRAGIVSTLQAGLERLTEALPWLAGQVINEGASEGNSGTFKIVPFEKTPRFVVKDLSKDPSVPTLEALTKAEFPSRLLDESVICPRWTLPGINPDEPLDPFPVFLVQANFIAGGLILSFVAGHNCFDFTGQTQVIYLLGKICRGEALTPEEITNGNLSRHDIVPFLDDSVDLTAELEHQTVKAAPTDDGAANASDAPAPPVPSAPPSSSWAYFNFTPAILSALKAEATSTLTSGFVSTDDALTAFLWRALLRTRLHRLDPARTVKITRAVDVRSSLGVPSTYPGILQNLVYYDYVLQELLDQPLGEVAAYLRSKLDPEEIKRATRALATLMHRSADKSTASFLAALDPSIDIMLSSWSKPDMYEWDLGLGLGKPVCVRRPQFTPVEGLIYLMPKSSEHGIAVGVCLRDEDMDRLKADAEFAKYGKFVG